MGLGRERVKGTLTAILLYFGQNCPKCFTKNLVCNMQLLLKHREENSNVFFLS